MKYIFSLILLVSILFLIVSCSSAQKIEALKPPLSDDSPMVFKNKTSFISLPTEITLKDIETLLNKNMEGLIYEDNELSDDNTEMKIWKTAPIRLTEKNGEILSVIPLKIWTKVKYGTSFMALNDTKEINLNGTITLNSKAHLYNWKLTTQSSITNFEWSESPNIVIAGKKVPITYLINPTISIFKNKIAKTIDEAIDASCDFKPMVLDAMEKISTPVLTNEAYEAWFKLVPVELYVTEAALKNGKITLDMGLKCTMQTMIGQEPKNTFDKNKLVLKPVKTIPNEFEVAVAAVSTYESASKVITKNFQGQEFGSGGKKVSVQKVNLWQNEGKLIIALDLLGSVNGTIYLSGYPQYNSVTKEIFFDKLDYVLNTKSVLLKSANWLAQGTILRKIQENCRYSIQENMDEGKKSMASYLNNYSPMKGVFINGNMNDFTFEKVELTNKAIIAFISTNGKMKITIDGME
ncbi:MAG: hypothetical protein CMP76_01990 [Flavobacterium sp.]|uniref:DUF4403 family protein n=1 Tax=Flavobacterium sp. TaxID=239 RepID=UPI000C45F8C4|nr:DUF4403 family protein [Flavobacterium sp.]MBF02045.1 hypothetical protein [Flavobacterium sp.]